MRLLILCVMGGVALAASSASALTPSECSAKFQEARKAGSLNGQRWNDFRAAQCGSEASATMAQATSQTAPQASSQANQQAAPAAANPLKAAPKPTSALVFPKGIAEQFAKEKPASARRKTCGAQFRANKASGGNGGLRWIQPGGGYWSECNKSLKGA